MIPPAGCSHISPVLCKNFPPLLYTLDSERRTVIPQLILVHHTAVSLVCDICHPNTPDPIPVCFRTRVEFLPEWLVEFLYHPDLVSHPSTLVIAIYVWPDLTLGNPFACAATIVTSPGCGFGLSSGIYCFTDR